jgi:S1-C subfamily serine protease
MQLIHSLKSRGTGRAMRRAALTALVLAALGLAGIGLAAAQDDTADDETSGRAYLGVFYSNADEGARIDQVIPDSPAEEAGLLPADIVTAVNATPVEENFAELIGALAPGDLVALGVTRGDETLVVELTLTEAPEDLRPGRGDDSFRFDFGGGRGRGEFNEMFRFNLGEVDYDEESGTWTVGELSEGSPLAAAGLQTGDVITAITVDGEPLNPDDLGRGLRLELFMADAPATLSVTRGDETLEIEVEPRTLVALLASVQLRFGMPDGFEIVPPFRGRDGEGFRFEMPNRPEFGGPRMPQPLGARLGVGFVMLDEQGAEQFGIAQTEGAYITQVSEASPATAAGLAVGDVVTAVDGEALTLDFTLRDAVANKVPGDVIALSVVRGDETLEIEVTLGQPEQFSLAPAN